MRKLQETLNSLNSPMHLVAARRCATAVPVALEAYCTGLPTSYISSVHLAHLADAKQASMLGAEAH